MANEIKFIFTGDTAAFDKAIDSVVKKTNKVKTATEKTTEAQKVQAKLQKLLNEEYNRGAKATGGILKIQKDIKRTEQERVKLSKRLNEASLTREKRLRTIVELSKKEAYLAGLTAAKRSGMMGAAGKVGAGALARLGLGAAASAGGAAAGAGIAAGASLFGPLGVAIVAVVAAVAAAVIALKLLKAVVTATANSMAKSMGFQKTAQMAGKTVEQVQAERVAGLFGGDADSNMNLFKQLGLIIDKEIIRSLAFSGKTIMAFAMQMANVIVPLLEKFAKALATVVKVLGATAAGLGKVVGPVIEYIKTGGFFMNPASALGKLDFSAFGTGFEDYWNRMTELANSKFMAGAAAGAGMGIAMQTPSDALTRIGLFKGGADSQLQTLKANLAAVQSIQGNTNGIIPAIENA